jgi:hypothetical protein
MRYLYRVDDDQPFAYAPNRRDFFLVSDDTLWAHESHAWLLSAASSANLVRRIADTYYDAATGAPLYYERADAPSTSGPVTATKQRNRR